MFLDCQKYLNSFTNWEPRLDQAGVSSFSVERMDALLKVFRHPESSLLFAHIAGSKGKGSTAAYLACILRAAGYRTGLYTSPHLYSLHERIRVLAPASLQNSAFPPGRPGSLHLGASQGLDPFEGSILPAELEELLRYHHRDIDRVRAVQEVTWYELMTALAVAHFAAKGVKVVVLETGLGGRLDATNIFETSVCGITPIGLEHTAILGDTLALIAAEKAAIIKSPSQRAVFAPQADEVVAVLAARAAQFAITPTLVGADMPMEILSEDAGGVTFSVSGRREYARLRTRLAGAHQAWNAACAIAMAEDLEAYGLVMTDEAVRQGVADTFWPGRFEIMAGTPAVVVDAAHTPESAAACARTFQKVFPGRKAVLLFGISADKDIAGVVKALLPVTARVVATRADSPRAVTFTPDDLKRLFPSLEASIAANVPAAKAEACRLAGRDGIVLAAGSVFLAAEARK